MPDIDYSRPLEPLEGIEIEWGGTSYGAYRKYIAVDKDHFAYYQGHTKIYILNAQTHEVRQILRKKGHKIKGSFKVPEGQIGVIYQNKHSRKYFRIIWDANTGQAISENPCLDLDRDLSQAVNNQVMISGDVILNWNLEITFWKNGVRKPFQTKAWNMCWLDEDSATPRLACTYDKSIKIWDFTTDTPSLVQTIRPINYRIGENICRVQNNCVATDGYYKNAPHFFIWDIATEKCIYKMPINGITGIVAMPDGKIIISRHFESSGDTKEVFYTLSFAEKKPLPVVQSNNPLGINIETLYCLEKLFSVKLLEIKKDQVPWIQSISNTIHSNQNLFQLVDLLYSMDTEFNNSKGLVAFKNLVHSILNEPLDGESQYRLIVIKHFLELAQKYNSNTLSQNDVKNSEKLLDIKLNGVQPNMLPSILSAICCGIVWGAMIGVLIAVLPGFFVGLSLLTFGVPIITCAIITVGVPVTVGAVVVGSSFGLFERKQIQTKFQEAKLKREETYDTDVKASVSGVFQALRTR